MHEDCKIFYEKISAYLDGELDAETCKNIDRHLKVCPKCLSCFESLKKTIEISRKFPREKVPKEIRERLRAVLETCLSRKSA